MKPGKIFCCMFLLVILGVTLHKSWKKAKRMILCANTTKQLDYELEISITHRKCFSINLLVVQNFI